MYSIYQLHKNLRIFSILNYFCVVYVCYGPHTRPPLKFHSLQQHSMAVVIVNQEQNFLFMIFCTVKYCEMSKIKHQSKTCLEIIYQLCVSGWGWKWERMGWGGGAWVGGSWLYQK